MANQLNTSVNSIVDYLNKKGEDSSFEARKRRYESLGLNQTLGDFRGSAQQNTELLKMLSAAPPSEVIPSVTNVPGDTAKSILDQASIAAQPPAQVQQQFKDVIPPKVQPSAEDILAAVRSKSSTQLEEEAARLAKEDIGRASAGAKSKAEAEKQAGYEKLQNRGLIRSPGFAGQVTGAAEAKVQEIDAEKISKELGVDIKLAKIIARGIEQELNDREKAKAAEAKKVEDYYRSQGMVFNPATGQYEKTTAETRAADAAARAAASAARTTSSEVSRFTKSQLNAGSENANMDLEEFKKLPPEEQNKFVQGGRNIPFIELRAHIGEDLDANKTVEEITRDINGNAKIVNKEDALNVLKQMVDERNKVGSAGAAGGILGRASSYISNFFNF